MKTKILIWKIKNKKHKHCSMEQYMITIDDKSIFICSFTLYLMFSNTFINFIKHLCILIHCFIKVCNNHCKQIFCNMQIKIFGLLHFQIFLTFLTIAMSKRCLRSVFLFINGKKNYLNRNFSTKQLTNKDSDNKSNLLYQSYTFCLILAHYLGKVLLIKM